MGISRPIGGAGILAAVALALPASAGYVEIGGGWAAEWDESLDGLVDIVSNGVFGDAVFIQKAAEFTQGSVFGQFPAIPIVFRQISYDNPVTHIVIDDEIITNSTGERWTDFHMQLVDGGDALFNPDLTLQSGGGGPIGFSIAPFQQAEFTADLKRLDIWDGVVEDGDVWFPGDGATDGQLWIDVNPAEMGEEFTVFTLKETPTPTPGVLALLALGGLVGTRRRR